MLKDVSFKTRLALVLFILGKITFLPTTFFLFTGQSFKAKLFLFIYITFIVCSLILSLMSNGKKDQSLSILNSKVKNCDSGIIKVKVKDGKIIEVV